MQHTTCSSSNQVDGHGIGVMTNSEAMTNGGGLLLAEVSQPYILAVLPNWL